MLSYRQVVDELRPLIEQARALFDLDGIHENSAFRKWRHEVTDLIERIEDAEYSVNCSIGERHFDELGSYTYTPSSRDRLAAFNRDLQDTINELATIVERFEKFGDPKAADVVVGAATPLKAPEKITAAWLWDNAPMSLWWIVIVAAVAIFGAGITAGQSSLFKELVEKLKPVETKSDKRATPNMAPHADVARKHRALHESASERRLAARCVS